jgi:hypothetical protein
MIILNVCLGGVGQSFCFIELNYITSHNFLSHKFSKTMLSTTQPYLLFDKGISNL